MVSTFIRAVWCNNKLIYQLFCFRNSDQDEAHPGPSCPAGSYAGNHTIISKRCTQISLNLQQFTLKSIFIYIIICIFRQKETKITKCALK